METIKYYISTLDAFDILVGIGLFAASVSSTVMVFSHILSR